MLAATVSTGCFSDMDEDKFGIQVTALMFQSNTVVPVDEENVEVYKEFIPLMYANSTNADYTLKEVTLSNASLGDLKLTRVNDYYQFADFDRFGWSEKPTAWNGTYRFDAESDQGSKVQASITLEISVKDTLGLMDVKSFTYENQVVNADVVNVRGAVQYGFIITPYNNGKVPSRGDCQFMRLQNGAYVEGKVVNIQFAFDSTGMNADNLLICPYACSATGVYLEGPKMTLAKGSDKFVAYRH